MRITILLLSLLFLSILGYSQDNYYKVNKQLDGAYARTSNGLLKFLYQEEYHDSDGLLDYRVYNWKHQVILSSSTSSISNKFGANLLEINTNTSSFNVGEFYLLEIKNEKNETWFLKFKVEDTPPLITNGLVMHYDFNNPTCYSSGTAVTDLVATHNGITTGSPILRSRNVGSTTGLNGNCMEFNGSQGINLANSFVHTNWTVSFWFHRRGNNNYYQRFWGMGSYRMELAERNGYFYIYDGGWFNTGVAIPTTGWHKVTFGYKNSPRTITIRIDGIQVYSAARGRTMNTIAYLTDSRDNSEAQCYLGEVLVYNKYLSDSEELYNYNNSKEDYGHKKIITDQLVMYYDFNDPSCYNGGTTVTDLASMHNGTTTGSPSLTSRNVGSTTGLSGNCMEFNGTQGVNLANSFNHTDWTVSFWFHRRGNNFHQRFWGMAVYRMELAEYNGKFYIYDGGWINTGVNVPSTGWHKVTFGYKDNPRELTIRINGVQVYSAVRGRTMNTIAYLNDSRDNSEAQSYIGQVLVYGKYLSDAEELYNFNADKEEYGY